MRWNASSRPPASHTATLILIFSSTALSMAPLAMRLASSSVRAMRVPPLEAVIVAWRPERLHAAGARLTTAAAGARARPKEGDHDQTQRSLWRGPARGGGARARAGLLW